MELSLDVHLRLPPNAPGAPPFEVSAAFDVAAGETVALLGPNGAGKTSVLQAVAGLVPLERGRISLGEREFESAPDGRRLPPEERGVGLLFQDHVLFPHLSALDNVAYGPRSHGASRVEARTTAGQWLGRVGFDPALHGARPRELSGGQAQRVALARALACGPRALLLDEPLSAIDATAKGLLRRALRAHLDAFDGPCILVAHDVVDALTLADRIAVLENGQLTQLGPAAELVARPGSEFVADLAGLNAFEGRCADNVVATSRAELTVASAHAGDVLVTCHPRSVSLYPERPAGSPRNVWRAPVIGVERLPDRARVELGGALPLVAEVTHASVAELELRPGREVWAAIKATELHVAPR